MKIKKIGIYIVLLLVGGFAGYLISNSVKQDSEGNDHGQHTEVSTDQIWTCSMHPQIRKNEPGDCPICGMDLIPLENDAGEANPMAVSMSANAMKLASVSTAKVGMAIPLKSVRLNGKIEADERHVYSQSSHIPGRIEKLAVNFTGEYVKKGQTIAWIYSPDLSTAQEELMEAMKLKESQPALYKAAREKLKNWKLTDAEIDEMINAGKIREQFPITADVSGYVIKKMVNLGDYIRRGEAILEIADLSKVWVMFDVYESDMPWIEKGDKVSFTVASLPGEKFTGEISFIDLVIDPKTRVAKARVEVNNKGLKLKPEMFVSGTIEAKLADKAESIVVPKTAVMWTGKRSLVYIKSTTNQGVSFLMREVTLGQALGDSFIVENGLDAGEEIAVNGTFSIDAAAQLAGKPSMMNPGGGPAMTGHNHGGQTMSNAEMSQMDVKDNMKQGFEVNEAFKKQLTQVYQKYLIMKNAFVASNAKQVSSDAKEVIEALNKVDMNLLKGDAHMAWMEQLEVFNSTLGSISGSTDIETQRREFSILNLTFHKSIKAFGLQDETVYYQYCTMAFSTKGAYWLSEKKNIENPYFGDAMLKCGETRETLNY